MSIKIGCYKMLIWNWNLKKFSDIKECNFIKWKNYYTIGKINRAMVNWGTYEMCEHCKILIEILKIMPQELSL